MENVISLGLLILLQAVLGLDNLLYVTLEAQRAPAAKQTLVRRMGIGIAVALRIGLLFALVSVIRYFQDPIFSLKLGIVDGSFNVHSLLVLAGGVVIMYTATKEILHMMNLEEVHNEERKPASVATIVAWIVAMNLVFSFDSILSAMALTDVFWVMATAIVAGGALMIWLSDRVAAFLQRNRMYEVLGLFILFVVGIMLLSEGGHVAHMHLFGQAVTPMSKTTFYFVIFVIVIVELVQNRYKKKLMKMREVNQWAKHS